MTEIIDFEQALGKRKQVEETQEMAVVEQALAVRKTNALQSFTVLSKAAAAGGRYARYFLALEYLQGVGTARDVPKAIELLESLLDATDWEGLNARETLAGIFTSVEYAAVNPTRAISLLTEALGISHDRDRLDKLVRLAEMGINSAINPAIRYANKYAVYDVAARLALQEKEKGQRDWDMLLGLYALDGSGGIEKSPRKAWEYFTNVLENDRGEDTVKALAAFEMATLCHKGTGMERDDFLASKYAALAARLLPDRARPLLEALVKENQGYAHWGMYHYHRTQSGLYEMNDSLKMAVLLHCPPAMACAAMQSYIKQLPDAISRIEAAITADRSTALGAIHLTVTAAALLSTPAHYRLAQIHFALAVAEYGSLRRLLARFLYHVIMSGIGLGSVIMVLSKAGDAAQQKFLGGIKPVLGFVMAIIGVRMGMPLTIHPTDVVYLEDILGKKTTD